MPILPAETFQALFERTDVRPGCVVSLQTLGDHGANFNPPAHVLISDVAFSAEGESLPLPALDAAAVMEVFRRLLLLRLHQARRLSENFMRNLLSWVHPGLSVFDGPPVETAALSSLESQARSITGPTMAMDVLQKLDDGRLALETPPDPRTGATRLELDPLGWIHRITANIPDLARPDQRLYGAYIAEPRVVDRILRHRKTSAARQRILSNPALRRAPTPVSAIMPSIADKPSGCRLGADSSREASGPGTMLFP